MSVSVGELHNSNATDGEDADIGDAEISIAPDGSFVETPSGNAARELKRRYDRLVGVGSTTSGTEIVISPFQITSLINQHGRQVYRVGRREMKPPAEEAEHVQAATIARASGLSTSDGQPRRSRLSMSNFLAPEPNNNKLAPQPSTATLRPSGGPPKKLRKARSNPALAPTPPLPTTAPPQRGHSQSVTAADLPSGSRWGVPPPVPVPPIPGPAPVVYPPTDLFAETMRFPRADAKGEGRSRRSSSVSRVPTPATAVIASPFGARVKFESPRKPREPSRLARDRNRMSSDSNSSEEGSSEESGPVDYLGVDISRQLREVQSFESGLTARAASPTLIAAVDTAALNASTSKRESSSDQGHANTDMHVRPAPLLYTQYAPEVFDTLQHYSGLPMLDRLDLDDDDGPVIRMSAATEERTTPRDDPRFVVWGELLPSPTPARAASNSVSSNSSHRKRRSGRPSAASTSSATSAKSATSLAANEMGVNGHEGNEAAGGETNLSGEGGEQEKVLLAATIERWLAQLTSALDYDELLVFFMTYRTFIAPLDCVQLLIARFWWGIGRSLDPPLPDGEEVEIETDQEDPDARARRIVRVRTFVAVRYWLLTFFDVDFLPNRDLRLLLAGWLNALRRELERAEAEDSARRKGSGEGSVGVSGKKRSAKEKERGEALGIVRKLIAVVREVKEIHAKRLGPPGNMSSTTQSSASASASTLSSASSSSYMGANQGSSTNLTPISTNTGSSTSNSTSSSNNNSPTTRRHPLVELFGKSFEGVSSETNQNTDDLDLDFEFDYLPPDLIPSSFASSASPFNPLAGHPTSGIGLTQHQQQPGQLHPNSTSSLHPHPLGAGTVGSVSGGGVAAHTLTLAGGGVNRAIMEHRPARAAPRDVLPLPLPLHQNILGRAFVNTIGKLGRWKRVSQRPALGLATNGSGMNGGAGGGNGGNGNGNGEGGVRMSAFDVELSVADDLLSVRGGVERYLRLIESEAAAQGGMGNGMGQGTGQMYPRPPVPPRAEMIPPDSPVPPSPFERNGGLGVGLGNGGRERERPPTIAVEVPSSSLDLGDVGSSSSSRDEDEDELDTSSSHPSSRSRSPSPHSPSPSPDPTPRAFVHTTPRNASQSRASSRASSRSSGSSDGDYGADFTSRFPHASMGVIPSFSRTSNDDFAAFAARSSTSSRANPWGVDVVSIDDLDLSDSDDEVLGGNGGEGGGTVRKKLPMRREVRHKTVSSISSRQSGRSSQGLGPLQQWQVDALVNSLGDEADDGGVEHALRKLEGQMLEQPEKTAEKGRKVDDWVATIRERLEAGDYGAPSGRRAGTGGRGSAAWSVDLGAPGAGGENGEEDHPPTRPASVASMRRVEKPRAAEVDPAVPDEILRSRLSTSPLSPQSSINSGTSSMYIPPSAPLPPPSKNGPPHRSWILDHTSTALAEHFAMIDRELLLAVRFDELLGDEWASADSSGPVLDWATFLKERARWRAERKGAAKTGGLVTLRARFNLVARFVLSEIVATPPASRPSVAAKFIRIAWKCYTMHNHSTLVAIIAGLRSEWANRAMRKHWRRVNVYNLRMLNDLSFFVGPEDEFVHLRGAVRALEEPPTPPEDGALPTCVPFIGVYLAQLARHAQLPDLIDPTAPTQAVGIDRRTNECVAPAHPEVFAALQPLPPSMQLEPLVNVHKQRLVAGTVRELTAGQNLAARLNVPVDKKLFARAVKLRALDDETLARVCAAYAE